MRLRGDLAMKAETDAQYERRVRAKAGRRHHHVWINYDIWRTWGFRPHLNTDLWVCDVPDCLAIRLEPHEDEV